MEQLKGSNDELGSSLVSHCLSKFAFALDKGTFSPLIVEEVLSIEHGTENLIQGIYRTCNSSIRLNSLNTNITVVY